MSVAGLDARGFLIGPLVAHECSKSFVPVRKGGKLPGKTISMKSTKEYGEVCCLYANKIWLQVKFLQMNDSLCSLLEYLTMIAVYHFYWAQCSFETQCSINSISIQKERIFLKILSAVLGGGLMTLCLPTPGTTQHTIIVVVIFVIIFCYF